MPPIQNYKNKELKISFKNDCTKLLQEFENLESLEFKDFSAIWRDFKFSLIYTPFESDKEHANFTAIAFFILKKFLMFPRNTFTQIGSLYLLYGMYYKQPIAQQTKIRLTLPEYQIIKFLINDMKENKIYDPVYVFAKLRSDNAFSYVYNDIVLAPELKYHSLDFKKHSDVFENFSASSLRTSCETLMEDNLAEVDVVDEEYQKCLRKFKESFSDLITDSSLQMFNTKPSEEIKKLYDSRKLIKAETMEGESSVGQKRKIVKLKAMSLKNPQFRSSYSTKDVANKHIKKKSKNST